MAAPPADSARAFIDEFASTEHHRWTARGVTDAQDLMARRAARGLV